MTSPVLLARLLDQRPLVTCPWCADFDRTDPRHAGLSHGICPKCAAKVEAEMTSR